MTTKARGRVRIEEGQKRVRVYLGGEIVADTRNVKLVWEKPYYPVYYIPSEDVNRNLLVDTGETHRTPSRGESRIYSVKAGGKEAVGAAVGTAIPLSRTSTATSHSIGLDGCLVRGG